MRRLGSIVAVGGLLLLAGGGGYWIGQHPDFLFAPAGELDRPGASGTEASGPVIYYRHPDGQPAYSANPTSTSDGRPFVAVHASEDISFEESGKPELAIASDEPARAAGRRVLYYRNPMGLPDTSPVPKKDNMGMDYIPVFEDADGSDSAVKLSPGKLQRTGVKTAEAKRSVISRPVRVPGTVTFDERRVSIVSTRTNAFVEQVADVTTGSRIAEGDPLVRFYAQEIAAAGALYASDLKAGAAGSTSGGALQRLQNLGVPAANIEQIRKTGKVPLATTLTAPRGGVVLARMAVDGMMAEAGAPLFRIADLSHVWVMADVPEYELSSIRVDATAVVRVRSLPGREFKGKVDLIQPEIEPQTRTARVRVELANPDGLLMVNMYADVEIAAEGSSPVVTVPDSAVIDSGDRQLVLIDKGEGSFEPRSVTVGARGQGMIEIVEGVAEGERVVVSANFLIDAESNLKAALSALQSGEGQP